VVETLCARQFACDCAEVPLNATPFVTEKDCVEHGDEAIMANTAALEQAIVKKTIDFDPQAAERCLAALRDLPCTAHSQDLLPNGLAGRPLGVCGEVFVGSVQLNEKCVFDFDCQGTAVCAPENGLCTTLPQQENENCVSTQICGSGLTCLEGVCTSRKTDGEPCSTSDSCISRVCEVSAYVCADQLVAGSDCSENAVCASGYCGPFDVCAGEQPLGAACQYNIDCNSGSCDFMTLVCVVAKANGEKCGFNRECLSQYCDTDKNCADKKDTTINCNIDEECKSGWCDANGCADKQADGSECTVDIGCLNGACLMGKCAPPNGENGPCQNDAHCTNGLYCHQGICVKRLNNGARCTPGAHRSCASGACRIMVQTAGTCLPLSDDGCARATP
jgi:hypothetical protein